MALIVDFKTETRMGYYYVAKGNGKRTKVWLCSANCTWAEIYFYNKVEDGRQATMTQLCGFICDLKHLERWLKNTQAPYDGLTFFACKMDAELWKAVKILTENGVKVTIK